MQFFELAGYPCPPLRNASDHYLQTINADFDRVMHKLKAFSHVRQNVLEILIRGNTCFVSEMSKSGKELYHEPYSVATFESCIAKAESVGTPKLLDKLCVHIPESHRCIGLAGRCGKSGSYAIEVKEHESNDQRTFRIIWEEQVCFSDKIENTRTLERSELCHHIAAILIP